MYPELEADETPAKEHLDLLKSVTEDILNALEQKPSVTELGGSVGPGDAHDLAMADIECKIRGQHVQIFIGLPHLLH